MDKDDNVLKGEQHPLFVDLTHPSTDLKTQYEDAMEQLISYGSLDALVLMKGMSWLTPDQRTSYRSRLVASIESQNDENFG